MIGEAAALTAALCWAIGSQLFGRIGRRGDATASAMNLGKCLTALVLFWLTGLILTGRFFPSLPLVNLAWLFASGVVGLSLGDGAYFNAILRIGARRALLLLSMAPVFTALGGVLILREPLHLHEAAGILAVVTGVALVVYEQQAPTNPAAASAPPKLSVSGLLFALGAAIGQAAGGLMSRRGMSLAVGEVSALDAALIRLPGGLIGILFVAASAGRLGSTARALRNPRLFGAIAGASVIGTYLGIWLSQVAIGRATSIAVASTLLATSPIFALPLGWILDREPVTLRAVTGTIVAVGGLALLTLGRA